MLQTNIKMALAEQNKNKIILKTIENMNMTNEQKVNKEISDLILKYNLLDEDVDINDPIVDVFFKEIDIILKNSNDKKFVKIKQEIRKRKLNNIKNI